MPICRSLSTRSVADPIDETIEALRALQRLLPQLTPADQAAVESVLPFATSEWQDGISCHIREQPKEAHTTPEKQALLDDTSETGIAARIRLTPDSGKLILVTVGLPARGKSLLVHRIEQFVSWRGYKTRAFSAGGKRRGDSTATDANSPAKEADPSTSPTRAQFSTASFFDPTKMFAMAKRDQVSLEAFDELLTWLQDEDGQVAIFDASNVTVARRAKLIEKANVAGAASGLSFGVVFIESIVTDPKLLEAQMRWKVRNSNDFAGTDEEAAMADLRLRIGHYEKVYETVEEHEGAYIKMFDLKAKVHVCNVYGRMSKSVLPYILAIHTLPRRVYMVVVGPDTTTDKETDTLHASLRHWAAHKCESPSALRILTSTAPRALAFAETIAVAAGAVDPAARSTLTPLSTRTLGATVPAAGGATGTPAGLTSTPPLGPTPNPRRTPRVSGDFELRFGESVWDLCGRLEPIALEIESATSPLCIVSHESECRALRAFLIRKISLAHSEREKIDPSFVAAPLQLLEFVDSNQKGFVETVVPLADAEKTC